MEPALYDHFFDIEDEHWWWRSRRSIALKVLDGLIPAPQSARVLDVGCGMGAWLRALPPRFEGYGVDISPKAVAGCRERGMTRVSLADGPRLPFEPGFFSAVCAFDVLEHLEEEGPILDSIREVLASSGWLIVTVPAFSFLWTGWDDLNEHKRRYVKSQLMATLEARGLRVAFCSYLNFILSPLAVLRRARESLPGRRISQARDFPGAKVPARPINKLLEATFSAERFLLARKIPLPWGSSLIAWARKA